MARVRTFVAVELPAAVRARLAALRQSLAEAGGDVNWVEQTNLHVTLHFLGEVDERDVPGVCAAVRDACSGVPPFPARVEGLGSFGGPRRPRTLWVGLGAGSEELQALHAAIETALIDLGCYRREERKFVPHVTLGRVRDVEGVEDLMAEVERRKGFDAGEFAVASVSVLSSDLRADGPTYAVMSRAKLTGT